MAPIDVLFIILILIAAVRGYFRGFVKEILSMAAPLLAILAGIFFSKPLSRIITPLAQGGGGIGNQIISFLIIFLVVYLVVFFVQKLLHGILETLHLVALDKALGVVLGTIEGLAVVFLITLIIIILPIAETRQMIAGSFFRAIISPFLPDLLSLARSALPGALCLKI
jgi:membrane protein required for colicin V production